MRIFFYVIVLAFLLVMGYFFYVSDLKFVPPDVPIAPLIGGLLGGLIGGSLAALGLQRRPTPGDSGALKLEMRELKKDIELQRLQVQQQFNELRRNLNSAVYGRSSIHDPQPEPFARQELDPPKSEPTFASENIEGIPERVQTSQQEIVARYRQVASGEISRSAFRAAFDELGTWGPVRMSAEGRRLSSSSDDEAFLVSVTDGGQTLVFPSYNFVSNQDTQFNTIASVPEEIGSAFDLIRGDGNILLSMPAIYRPDGEGEAELISKGEIRGFAG